MEWIDFLMTGWPDWVDSGRRVEIVRDDGIPVSGKLQVDDFIYDGEGDEIPIFTIITDGGTEYSFADQKRWRFLDSNK